jgi:hypothetical protein
VIPNGKTTQGFKRRTSHKPIKTELLAAMVFADANSSKPEGCARVANPTKEGITGFEPEKKIIII